jgi:Anti-sigma-K factor rskA
VPHPSPDQLALAALPAEPVEPEVADHLHTCRTCRAKVASLRHTVDIARDGTTDPATDPGPPPRVWHTIIAELDDELGAPPPMPRARWRRLLVPAAATAASLAAGLILGLAASSPAPVTLAQIPLTPLAPGDPATSGTANVVEYGSVRRVVIEVTEPARGTAGEYLEAWLMDTDGRQLYSLGTLTPEPDDTRFHGTFRLPPDLQLTTFDTVDVSAERFDGNPTHSGASLLRGRTA